MQKAINTAGNRSSKLEWDVKDRYSDKLGRGFFL